WPTPSSQTAQKPSRRIDPRSLLEGKVANEPALFLGMGSGAQGPGFLGRIGDEAFLAGDADAAAPVMGENLGSVSLEPGAVALVALLLFVRPGDLTRVG